MSMHMKSAAPQRQERTEIERLGLRVSSMINHPLVQAQRWVLVHRLDTNGDVEWEEVMGLLSDTPELGLTSNNDESVMVRWERSSVQQRDDFIVEQGSEEPVEEVAPF